MQNATFVFAGDFVACAAMSHGLCFGGIPFQFFKTDGASFVSVESAHLTLEKFEAMAARASSMAESGRKVMAAAEASRGIAEAIGKTKQ